MTSIDFVVSMIRALNASEIPYMVVESLSSNAYGIPRLTKEADFVIQCAGSPLAALRSHLDSRFSIDPQLLFESATGTKRNVVKIAGSDFQIGIFRLSDDPHDQERFRRRRLVHLPEFDAVLPSPEDVIVTKLRWILRADRNKDRDDVHAVISVSGSQIDWDYVHRWCAEHGTRALLDEIRATVPAI